MHLNENYLTTDSALIIFYIISNSHYFESGILSGLLLEPLVGEIMT
jgi:hypothetical protein